MAVYKSKPARHVEAMEVPEFGDLPSKQSALFVWLGAGAPWKLMSDKQSIEVVTISGNVAIAKPGDYIIKEPDGIHHYPCEADVFAARYVLVD